jgi:hypothetical protein
MYRNLFLYAAQRNCYAPVYPTSCVNSATYIIMILIFIGIFKCIIHVIGKNGQGKFSLLLDAVQAGHQVLDGIEKEFLEHFGHFPANKDPAPGKDLANSGKEFPDAVG